MSAKIRLNLANRLTLGRIVAIPFFAAAVLYYSPDKDYLRFAALGIFLFAAVLDFLDGYIARKFGQVTRAGSILDPLADKMLLMSAFICLHLIRKDLPIHFPVWFVVFVISRDVILMLGALVMQIVKGNLHPQPSTWGKAGTFVQICSVAVLLLQWPYAPVVWYMATAVSAVAALQYLRNGLQTLSEGSEA
ncbi:MAG: CDP-diacylglycerol--glycerol-3-phosphate 3-phosphatidyltransferase [Candidatus Omnitrophica bacterium CG12_big_fil_rev_8_21_14_0_65_50_5]|nr:MAG: CDP-diacylglycerol--glycerol-3-phosphate 3-phosphatidyltransferase [Candidatus Omnitrophica bacterium CG12_big_fil_rev_8_21_14_0_65_50_5]